MGHGGGVAERLAGEQLGHGRQLGHVLAFATGPRRLPYQGLGAVDRPVARIVRPRRDLVDQNLAGLRDEHFDCKHPDEVELLSDMTGDDLGAHRDLRSDAGRGDRRVEDMAGMLIFDRRIGRPGAVAAAGDDDRNLAGEIDKAFEDANLAAHALPGFLGLGFRRQRHLALAVIAQPHALQHRRVAKVAHRPEQGRRTGNLAVGGGVDIDRAEKILFPQSVLRDLEDFGTGQHRAHGRHPPHCLGRDVFELEGGDVHGRSEALERFTVQSAPAPSPSSSLSQATAMPHR